VTSSHAEESGKVKPHIWFKLTYSLVSMSVTRKPKEPITVSLPNDQQIIFWMRTFPEEKQIQPQLCCSATAQHSMNEKLYSHFQKFAERLLPQDSTSQVSLPHRLSFDAEIDEHGKIPENWGVRLAIFPNNFQALHREMSSKLHTVVESYMKTLRWVQSASGKQAALARVSFEYSFDKETWHSMPSNFNVSVHSPKAIELNKLKAVTELWTRNEFEPLAHELLREAFDLLRSNQRSALLIGSTALETGFKHFIDFLLPNAGMLLEKMPSPPPLTMIRDIIPEIQKKLAKPEFRLRKDELDLLQKWNTIRNKVAHGLPQKIDNDALEEYLLFVQKLLYCLDQQRGHSWASTFAEPLAEETRPNEG